MIQLAQLLKLSFKAGIQPEIERSIKVKTYLGDSDIARILATTSLCGACMLFKSEQLWRVFISHRITL
ncbi:hypothetical protein APB74_23840 [Pseudomonas aeruginosa]|nr:hypothetical protein APB67_25865 [Pseudomonas aeruginosa]KST02201.1 hypothetical protein APB74_23840 [Pseudomonas aeruginosa]